MKTSLTKIYRNHNMKTSLIYTGNIDNFSRCSMYIYCDIFMKVIKKEKHDLGYIRTA